MKNTASLTDLFNLSVLFSDALEQKAIHDPSFETKLKTSVSVAENAIGLNLCDNAWDKMPKAVEDAVFDDLAVDYVSDETALAYIRFSEYQAYLLSRIANNAEILTLIPEERKSITASSAFTANGAPNLARLFAPKAP